MKRGLLLALLALALAAGLGALMVRDPGYLALAYDGWVFESSLWFGALLLGLLGLVVALGRRLLWGALGLSQGVFGWRSRRAAARAPAQLLDRLEAVLGGETRVPPSLPKDVGLAPALLTLDALLAALAGQALRDEAARAAPRAAALLRARAAAVQGDGDGALAALAATPALFRSALLQAWITELVFAAQRPLALLPTFGHLGQAGESLVAKAFEASAQPTEALSQAYDGLPKDLRRRVAVQVAYAEAVQRAGASALAEKHLRTALKDSQDDRLRAAFGRLQSADPAAALKVAQGWLGGRRDDPVVLLAVGRLALQAENVPVCEAMVEACEALLDGSGAKAERVDTRGLRELRAALLNAQGKAAEAYALLASASGQGRERGA